MLRLCLTAQQIDIEACVLLRLLLVKASKQIETRRLFRHLNLLFLSLRLLNVSVRHVLQAKSSDRRCRLRTRLAQRFERLKATNQIRLTAACSANTFNIDVQLFTGLERKVLAAINLRLLVDALLKFVILHILVKCADEIEAVVALRELQPDICFLASLLINQQKCKEPRAVDTSLHESAIIFRLEN